MGQQKNKTIEGVDPEKLQEKIAEHAAATKEKIGESLDAADDIEKTEKVKSKKVVRKKIRGKNYQKIAILVDKNKFYPQDEALDLLQKNSYTKFDASVEAHFNLNINSKSPDQAIKLIATLPHPILKTKKIVIFTEKVNQIKKDANVQTGSESLIDKIAKKQIQYDIVISTPEMMPKIAKLAKLLGRKGLMPNPKSGTITDEPQNLIEEIKKGRIEIKTDAAGVAHLSIGKISWDQKQIKENLAYLIDAIRREKPASVKKEFIRSVTLSSTMGPGIKIEI